MNKSSVKNIVYFFIILFAATNIFGQTQVPRFEIAPCAVPIPDGVKVECGNLFVKENRARTDSRTIRMSVIIVKSTAQNPAPDSILYTNGGPGASSLNRVRGAGNLVPFTKERDYIIYEQRGTRFAEPNLQCAEVNAAIHRNWEQNLNIKQARQMEVRAAKACHDRLIKEGVDLSAYNSAENAADLEDLRRVLGVSKWNLYGISYSTRLMLTYIRNYGEHVRSVVLDSVLPPTVNWDESDVENIMNSFDKLLDVCARGAKCSADYPRLKERFFTFLKNANKKPVTVEAIANGKTFRINLDGNAIFDFVYNLLEDNGALAEIPKILNDLANGKTDALKSYAEGNLTGEGFIWGMRYSVWCTEEMPFQNARKIAAQAGKFSFIKGFKVQGALPEICKVWDVPAADAIENTAVKSDVPALVFAGAYDPDTTPAWSKMVASWFPNSFFYELKNSTHGANNNRCTFVDITASFVNDPSKKPNDACFANISPIVFK